jgi:hypothetical protein
MVADILAQIKKGEANFKDALAFIEEHYFHKPIAFKNGSQYNAATENQGSARVFAFGKQQGLSKEDTLQLFAEHYKAVLENPEGNDHQNIRQFMIHGWEGIVFE